MLNTDMALVIDTSTCQPTGNGNNQRIEFGGVGGAGDGTINNRGACEFNDAPYQAVLSYSGDINTWKAAFLVAMQKMNEMEYST